MTGNTGSEQRRSETGVQVVQRGEHIVGGSLNDGGRGFVTREGMAVLLSAPHAVTHIREGMPKQAEPRTDVIAAGVADVLGLSAIWSTSSLSGDPNWDMSHPYKDEALRLALGGVALDLHVMENRGFDICLGLGDQKHADPRLWKTCAEVFLSFGHTVSINYPFSAGRQTVTGFMQENSVRAIQVEMTWDVCNLADGGVGISAALVEICELLSEEVAP